ncbi:hypothetical protein B0T18DRAFT_124477 [Schizothecium vesticola]|uniref:Uncharacterized protein n=1 Tax=Schizothecium vesticola TaxID=314040 RepID=A0AA40K8T6_9PEZI|nr:hypothetical protein B0T18DRAFT_124477 [Schizothecium vesticola]
MARGWERRFPHSERERQGGTAVGAAGVERGESPTTRGPVDSQRVGCPAAILVCRVAPRQEGRPLAKRGLGRRSSTTMHLAHTGCRKHLQRARDLSGGVFIQPVSACQRCRAKEAWPYLVMTGSQHPRHRRGLGPARDEPPSQNRVHGWGSVCCVMRSCPARGHGNQGDDELSRIWACKSRRCRPPQTGVPATRENIAASTTHDSDKTLRCCRPQYPCIRVAPFSPARSGLATETRLETIPHPSIGPGSRAASLVSELQVHSALSIFSSRRHEPQLQNSQRCGGPLSSSSVISS